MGLGEMGAGVALGRESRKAGGGLVEALDRNSEILEAVLKRLDRLPEGLRQSLADHLWADMASTTFERLFQPSGTLINLQPQTNMPRRVTAILTFCGGNQTGFLTLGRDIIPVPAGSFFFDTVAIPLEFSDVCSLTIGTPGGSTGTPAQMFFGMWSTIQPRWGELT